MKQNKLRLIRVGLWLTGIVAVIVASGAPNKIGP
jgi:hypothetical protein